MKSVSPNRLSWYIALSSSTLVTLCLIFAYYLDSKFNFIVISIVAILSFFISFYITRIFIRRYLDRKIKLIYKTIHNFKVQKDFKSEINMDRDVLGDISKEVSTWATSSKTEIDKLKELEKYRKEFIGNLAHELKTPVFSVQGYILTLLEGGLDDPEVSEKFLNKASKGVDRIASIVQDLDTIMKMESTEIELDIRKWDIVQLVKDAIDELEEKASLKNISMSISLEEKQMPIHVLVDKQRIMQVLINLILNSINYGRIGGSTKVKFFDMDENILVEVTDNGPGIAQEFLPRLFERFFRVDKSRARDQGGTGLGLSIVKHIIESHGQTINVRSTVNVGSTFYFTLKKAN